MTVVKLNGFPIYLEVEKVIEDRMYFTPASKCVFDGQDMDGFFKFANKVTEVDYEFPERFPKEMRLLKTTAWYNENFERISNRSR